MVILAESIAIKAGLMSPVFFVYFDINFIADFNINVNGQDMRLSYDSVWQSYNQKLKFVDKITHFIINIGDFVNKMP